MPRRTRFGAAVRCVGLVFLVGLGSASFGALPDAQARDEGPGTPTTEVEDAIARLASPFARVRELAFQELLAALPGARAQILKAVDGAGWGVKSALARVLAADASDKALHKLMDVLAEADAAQATSVLLEIVRDRPTSARLLAMLRTNRKGLVGDKPARERPVAQLHTLLIRAEIEDKFISRKSPTGSTGYYRGQYDILRYAREAALEVVLHIAADKAIAVPGVYRHGPYRFLRPRAIDFWEIQGMAVNAIGELAKPSDKRALEKLRGHRMEVEAEVDKRLRFLRRTRSFRAGPRLSQVERDALMDQFQGEVGKLGDYLLAEYLVLRSAETKLAVELYLQRVQGLYRSYFRLGEFSARSITATTMIRAGWYADAVEMYTRSLRDRWTSRPTAYSNIACAFAQWSLDTSLSKEEQAEKLAAAIRNLGWSVTAGWDDLSWMMEDGDLDPLRALPAYKALERKVRQRQAIIPDDD